MNPVIKSKVAMLALGIAAAALVSVAPASAGKSGSQGGGQYRATTSLTPKPPMVRDHRPAVVRDARAEKAAVNPANTSGGVKVASYGSRGGVQCLGNMCGLKKTINEAKRIAIKRTIPR
ncbi:MAG: hypothetical protein K8F62_04660 [Pseudorhodoplanes sp.]|nr:hypothetical protein [Pseudorhodoplanes sp.]